MDSFNVVKPAVNLGHRTKLGYLSPKADWSLHVFYWILTQGFPTLKPSTEKWTWSKNRNTHSYYWTYRLVPHNIYAAKACPCPPRRRWRRSHHTVSHLSNHPWALVSASTELDAIYVATVFENLRVSNHERNNKKSFVWHKVKAQSACLHSNRLSLDSISAAEKLYTVPEIGRTSCYLKR